MTSSGKLKTENRKRRRISTSQRVIGWVLVALGVLVLAVGLFGMLAGDWQLAALSDMADQVYAARETAQNAGTAVTGAFDLNGEDSGVHIYYADLKSTEDISGDDAVLNANDLSVGESKKALKAGTLQIPATKDNLATVIEEEAVTLSNGEVISQSVKFPGAGSSKYASVKMSVDGACTLQVWAKSSLPGEKRKIVLYNTTKGALQEAYVPAFDAEGTLEPVTFTLPQTGTYFVISQGEVPIAPVSALMNFGTLIFLAGLVLIFNGIMLQIQTIEKMKDLLFVEPALVFFLAFVYYPVIDLARISFTGMTTLTTGKQTFVGLANYNWLFFQQSGAPYFWDSLRITGTYMFWEVAITLVGGMLLALLFNRMTRAFNTMRAIVFMPKYIAVSTSATVFMWILHSTGATGIGASQGILNYALSLFGIEGPHWLIDADTALSGVLLLTGWRVVGYAMMIYLSAMKGIPTDYYEAAAIDGADGVQRFRYITLPMLAPTTLFLLVTTFIASMKVFQSVDVMTGGGPGKATNVMVQWIYNLTFTEYQTGHASAVSVVFFLILLVFTAATMRFSQRKVSYDS